MLDCPVCGDNNYERLSGFYYCTTCQTQSQSLVDMDIENFDASCYKHAKRLKKVKTTKEEKFGRLWTTTEGFQFVIKEQVKALIELGANPKLKDIVFDIWVKYLRKTNIAFCPENSQQKPLVQTCLTRARDAHVATSKSPYIKPLQRSKVRNDSSEDIYGKRRAAMSLYRNIERMSMIKTISFCYLGLLYTNNLTTPSDIVRWISIGKIPYMNASNLFPENIKFFTEDTLTFNSANIPLCWNIRKTCGLLAYFLELTDLPSLPVMKLAHKYLCHLDLPGELHGMLNNLTYKTPNIWVNVNKSQVLPPYETIAMAYVVVLLKMFFGLDDETERNLSNFAKVYSSYNVGEQKIFIWNDWVVHINKKIKRMMHYRGTLHQHDTLIVQHLQQFLNYCEEMSRSKTRMSVLNECRLNKEDISNSIQSIFNLMTDRLKASNPSLEENLLNTSADQDAMFDDSTFIRDGTQGVEFQKASIRFLTHPKTFLSMNPFNISNSTISSVVKKHSQMESEFFSNDNEHETESIISSMSASSAAEVSSDSNKKKWERIRHVLVRKLHGAKRQKINVASRKKLLTLLSTSYKKYVKLPDKTITSNASSQKKNPLTYLWLLHICSSIIEENYPVLDCQVKNIEGLHHIRKISKFRNLSLRHFQRYCKEPS